jgi:uncharacterized protein YecE (DUF72 family)
MKLLAGTSGYSYKQWKGPFYPADLPDNQMLRFYGERFPAVEINNTFYRMPAPGVLTRWAEETPADFVFVLKAPARITHQKRLADVEDPMGYFLKVSAALGPKLGPVLYQLPPFLRKDVERLRAFLARLPPDHRAAFEFRHPSWFDEAVYDLLKERAAALCVSDMAGEEEGEEAPPAPLVPTTSWGYLRLRRVGYDGDELRSWADRIRAQPWQEAFVFFKHEEEGKAPAMAARLRELVEGAG